MSNPKESTYSSNLKLSTSSTVNVLIPMHANCRYAQIVLYTSCKSDKFWTESHDSMIHYCDSCIAVQYETGPGQGNLFSGNSGIILSLKYTYLVTLVTVVPCTYYYVITTNTKYIAVDR